MSGSWVAHEWLMSVSWVPNDCLMSVERASSVRLMSVVRQVRRNRLQVANIFTTCTHRQPFGHYGWRKKPCTTFERKFVSMRFTRSPSNPLALILWWAKRKTVGKKQKYACGGRWHSLNNIKARGSGGMLGALERHCESGARFFPSTVWRVCFFFNLFKLILW